MATYLDRYLAGERELVWRELVAAGDRVRSEPLLGDARAVAHETMRRVRHNLELIVDRLRQMDYQFLYPDGALTPPDPDTIRMIEEIEREAGPIPIALRAFYQTVGTVCLMGSHPRLSAYEKSIDLGGFVSAAKASYAKHLGDPGPAPAPPAFPPDSPLARLAAHLGGSESLRDAAQLGRLLMQRVNEIPAEMDRMSKEGAPSANFQAIHRLAEDLRQEMTRPESPPREAEAPVSDPLVVWAPDDSDIDALRYYGDDEDDHADDDGWTGRYAITIAPDDLHKANISGGGPYEIIFPNSAVDAPIEGAGYGTFVEYLRHCFARGGFAALDPAAHADDIAHLTRDLLPI